MIGTIIIKEVQNYLFSLRFHVSFILVIFVFGIGTFGEIKLIDKDQEQYLTSVKNNQETLNSLSENITNLAVKRQLYQLSPRNNKIISDCHEDFLPNTIQYSAYNVFSFWASGGGGVHNPFMKRSQKMSWSFIIIMMISFLAMVFSFDSISGEKEDKTLALTISNPVPRATLLIGKFISIVSVLSMIVLVGLIVGLIIILIKGSLQLDTGFYVETIGFFLVSILFISVFTAFGLFSSMVTRKPNVSLLISLCMWLFFVIFIPNSASFWALKLFPIKSEIQVTKEIKSDYNDLNRNAPPGSWASNGGNPFFPNHELRANLQMSFLLNDKEHKDAHYQEMMGQFEKTRNLITISPVSLYDYSIESFFGGGYLRFKKNWEDMHVYQEQFLAFFKARDAEDEKSPHWYNPYEGYSTSRLAVSVEEVPVYSEKDIPMVQRLKYMLKYAAILFMYCAIVMVFCIVRFNRYDTR